MDKKEAADALLLGANNTNSEYLTVRRVDLLAALGAETTEEATDAGNSDAPAGKVSRRQGR